MVMLLKMLELGEIDSDDCGVLVLFVMMVVILMLMVKVLVMLMVVDGVGDDDDYPGEDQLGRASSIKLRQGTRFDLRVTLRLPLTCIEIMMMLVSLPSCNE